MNDSLPGRQTDRKDIDTQEEMSGQADHVDVLIAVDGHGGDFLLGAVLLSHGLQIARGEEDQGHPSTHTMIKPREHAAIPHLKGGLRHWQGGRVVEPIAVPEHEGEQTVDTSEEGHLLELVVSGDHGRMAISSLLL